MDYKNIIYVSLIMCNQKYGRVKNVILQAWMSISNIRMTLKCIVLQGKHVTCCFTYFIKCFFASMIARFVFIHVVSIKNTSWTNNNIQLEAIA